MANRFHAIIFISLLFAFLSSVNIVVSSPDIVNLDNGAHVEADGLHILIDPNARDGELDEVLPDLDAFDLGEGAIRDMLSDGLFIVDEVAELDIAWVLELDLEGAIVDEGVVLGRIGKEALGEAELLEELVNFEGASIEEEGFGIYQAQVEAKQREKPKLTLAVANSALDRRGLLQPLVPAIGDVLEHLPREFLAEEARVELDGIRLLDGPDVGDGEPGEELLDLDALDLGDGAVRDMPGNSLCVGDEVGELDIAWLLEPDLEGAVVGEGVVIGQMGKEALGEAELLEEIVNFRGRSGRGDQQEEEGSDGEEAEGDRHGFRLGTRASRSNLDSLRLFIIQKKGGFRDFGPPPAIKEIFSPSPALRRRRRSRRRSLLLLLSSLAGSLRAHSSPPRRQPPRAQQPSSPAASACTAAFLAGSHHAHSRSSPVASARTAALLAGSLRVHSSLPRRQPPRAQQILAGSLRAHSSPLAGSLRAPPPAATITFPRGHSRRRQPLLPSPASIAATGSQRCLFPRPQSPLTAASSPSRIYCRCL
ncbi:hypothetical protein ZIOFF_010960 [Zingiber officinale]|uniref:Uncharacterized protein n=1 Tax=Zingiber officinale TaxID=94328 RepID=A0A8J5I778_ZINOF|nr:hypothetical protein ZIOFF_010960 [Zingiber officinale]